MPRGKFKRYKRKYKKKGKVYKRGIPRKALTGPTDTMLERAMERIANKVVNSNLVRLVDRNYYFGTVDRDFNLFSGGHPIDFKGVVKQIAEIDKQDLDMILNNPDHDGDEDQKNDEQDLDGVTQGMSRQVHHGRRLTDMVLIDGVTVMLKIYQEPMPGTLPSEPNVAHSSWFQRSVNGALTRQWPEDIVLKFRVVQLFFPAAQEDGQNILDKPSIAELLPLRTWGYDSKLDTVEYNEYKWSKKRVLLDETIRYKINSTNTDKTITKRVFFRKPLLQKFLPADQNGQQATTFKLFFCARSNIPQTSGTQGISYDIFKPKIHVCIKTHYHE